MRAPRMVGLKGVKLILHNCFEFLHKVQTKNQVEDVVWLAGNKLRPDFSCLKRSTVCGYRCHNGRLHLRTLFVKAKEITPERLSRIYQSSEQVEFDEAGVQPDQIKFQEQPSSLQLDLAHAHPHEVLHKGP